MSLTSDRDRGRQHNGPEQSPFDRPGGASSASRIAEQDLISAVERASSAAALFDDQRRFVAVSEPLLAVHRRSREQLVGHRIDEFMTPDQRAVAIREFDQMLDDGRVISALRLTDSTGAEVELLRHGSANVLPGLHLVLSIDSRVVEAGDESTRGDVDSISVVVVAPDSLTVDFLVGAVEENGNCEVVSRCVEPERIEAVVRGHRPDLVIVASSPFAAPAASSGAPSLVETVTRVVGLARNESLATSVLVVHHRHRPDIARQVLEAGARGIVGPEDDRNGLRRALARVAAGEIYMHPALAMKVIRLEADGHGVLTQRESEVLRLVALGWTSAEIAGELFISPRTVDTHRARINEKLGFASRRELVAYAIEHDLIAS